jgi:hypothetical protein
METWEEVEETKYITTTKHNTQGLDEDKTTRDMEIKDLVIDMLALVAEHGEHHLHNHSERNLRQL